MSVNRTARGKAIKDIRVVSKVTMRARDSFSGRVRRVVYLRDPRTGEVIRLGAQFARDLAATYA